MRPLPFTPEELRAFCTRWRIAELSLFGSVLRDDFGPDSDVDVLVRFAPEATDDPFDLLDLEAELATWFGREVDVVDVRGLRNPFRRHEILRTRRVVFAEAAEASHAT